MTMHPCMPAGPNSAAGTKQLVGPAEEIPNLAAQQQNVVTQSDIMPILSMPAVLPSNVEATVLAES